MITITNIEVHDIRFPTSSKLDGSDAMNPDPNYSAAYVVLKTNSEHEGHGLTFTIGRGNELCVAAINSLSYLIKGQDLNSFTWDMAGFYRMITGDSQLRWLGPEKGVIHMATSAIINAVWDLYAKVERKPLWLLLSDMSPEELVKCVDFTYISDVLTPGQSIELLQKMNDSKQERIRHLRKHGYPAYTTSVGWLGYPDEKLRNLCRTAKNEGWKHFKMKVGLSLQDDMRRAAIIREEIGSDLTLMMDANQKWGVEEAIKNMKELQKFNPWWIEEPTSPDDVLGHQRIAAEIAPILVATGEHCANRVMFKQFLQAKAIGICQIDSCRLGGVNENLAVMLMAAKFQVPVCPHAGGVGLCEYVQHLSMFDFIALTGSIESRVIEYVDHLHEHFLYPVTVKNGSYFPPEAPGYSIQMKAYSIENYKFQEGIFWAKP